MPQQDDYALIEQSKTDIKAFEKLYSRYFQQIYRYCRARVNSTEEAEDITSEVFVSAIKFIYEFNKNRGSFSSWLYRTAHNRIIDLYRAKYRGGMKITEANEPTQDDNNFASAEIEIRAKQVNNVLTTLKSEYQLVLSLRFFSELTNPEIAEILDCKPSNVAVLVNRALEKFRKEFQKNFPKSEIFELVNRNN